MEDTEIPETAAPSTATASGSILNRIIAISALLTSMVSIFLGVQNAGSMNDLVEANSWPHPTVRSSNFTDGVQKIRVDVVNQGVGQALLHDFVVYYEGEPVRNAGQLISSCCLGGRGPFGSTEDFQSFVVNLGTYSPSGRVIRPGEVVPVFNLTRVEENAELWDQVNLIRFGPLTFKGCFCSVFNECWESNMVALDKTPVESCAISEEAWRG